MTPYSTAFSGNTRNIAKEGAGVAQCFRYSWPLVFLVDATIDSWMLAHQPCWSLLGSPSPPLEEGDVPLDCVLDPAIMTFRMIGIGTGVRTSTGPRLRSLIEARQRQRAPGTDSPAPHRGAPVGNILF